MKRVLTTLLLCQLAYLTTFADNADVLTLKDGTAHNGYIAVQMPGKQIVFKSGDQIDVFEWKDIRSIQYVPHNPEQETGLVDIIETRDNKVYRGQITGQTFGESVIINTDNGYVTVNNNNIKTQKKEKLSPDYSLFEQAPYENTVTTDKEKVTGVIIRQDYGNDTEDPYIIVMTDNDIPKRVLVADIEQIARHPNRQYKEVLKFKAESGKVYVNQEEIYPLNILQAKKTKSSDKKKDKNKANTKKNGLCVINEDDVANSPTFLAEKGKIVVVIGRLPSDSNRYLLAQVTRQEVGKNNPYAFEPEDIVMNSLEPTSSSVQQDQTIRKEYFVNSGAYVLYAFDSGQSYFFFVK